MDKSSITTDYEPALVEVPALEEPDVETSKRLVRKLDLIVLPLLAIIYFTHSLDRANLGNAKTDGFEKDIGLKDNQYSLILILFYIPYGKELQLWLCFPFVDNIYQPPSTFLPPY